jgi:hypothetical protein
MILVSASRHCGRLCLLPGWLRRLHYCWSRNSQWSLCQLARIPREPGACMPSKLHGCSRVQACFQHECRKPRSFKIASFDFSMPGTGKSTHHCPKKSKGGCRANKSLGYWQRQIRRQWDGKSYWWRQGECYCRRRQDEGICRATYQRTIQKGSNAETTIQPGSDSRHQSNAAKSCERPS